MGIPSRLALHARYRDGPDRGDDPGKTPTAEYRGKQRFHTGLILAAVLGVPAGADPLRIATFNTELQRDGPGLLLRDIVRGGSPDVDEALARIVMADPDVLLLQGFDYDHGLAALSAFAQALRSREADYPHQFALRPNSGRGTGRDLDGDGRSTGARDAHGYGQFAGQGGMAILSRHPIIGQQDHSAFLWADLPGTLSVPADPGAQILRLSSVAHWTVTVAPPGAEPFHLLAFHATPPVFDGPEDRNGRRNHDEAAFWTLYLDGALGLDPPRLRYIILGDANLDTLDGDGRPAAMEALLSDPRLQDPKPSDPEGRRLADVEGGANERHRGRPENDTANWRDAPGPGNLRVDYVLPSVDWTVAGSGIVWAPADAPSGRDGASRHGLVWVDLR